ncbi:MAG: response regulator transcription factor [Gammaproteobacteria bacterium]|nr:response regulator transcription factor [Gammaproteobacteria bacterium]MBU1647648.1 response regulator transcription factor [Gammaproteobacteria bacterium]MBU1973513.1 response regulator transcription factor [Gammaproteobacteria bacterium]
MPGDDEAEACFAAAVRGYGNTHSVPALLKQIADVVAQGGLWIGESLMQRLLRGVAQIPPPAPIAQPAVWDELLTEREREVAQVVAAGASNKEIARELGITERTVKAHVGAVLDKLGVRDRLQLALVVNGHRRN